MKQPFNGLFSVQTLKNNYLSVVTAAVLLCFSLSLSAQTYDSTRKLQIVGGDGFIWKSGEFLGKMKAPTGLAPLSSKDSGAMSFSNGSMYFFNGATWNKIGTGSGGSTIVAGAPDSTYARFVNTTGKNYRIVAVGVTGGTVVTGGAFLQPSDTINRYPRIIAGTNISVTGTYPNLTITASGGGTTFDTTTIYKLVNSKLDTAARIGIASIKTSDTQVFDSVNNYVTPFKLLSKENSLGNPITNGYILSSTTAGNRSWIAPTVNSGGTVTSVVANAPLSVTGSATATPTIIADTSTITGFQTKFRTDSARSNIYTAIAGKQTALGFTPYNSTNPNNYISSYTETDPIVKAINGIVKSNGATISAAVSGTDYLSPTGSAAGLTNFPTFNQSTTGNAATATNLTGLTTTVATLNNQSGTNTGDNSPNTLYSGLVSNATHTGDATGATALTVKGINGTLLSGLSTGILKNTTTTGVPSIAVAGDFPALNYQAPLTSGTNIQTINGTTILAGSNRQLLIPSDTTFLDNQVLTNTSNIATKGRVDSIVFNNSGLIHAPASVSIANKIATVNQTLANQNPYTLLGRGAGTGIPSFLSSIDSNYAPTLATVNALNNGLAGKQPSGTYLIPNDTINKTVRLIAGTNIGITGTYPNLTINGSAGGATAETDPIVKAINGIVKSNGTTIAAAVAADFPVLPYVDLTTAQTIAGVKTFQGSSTTDAGAAALILKNSAGTRTFEIRSLTSPTNVALGVNVLPTLTTGTNNTGIGYQSGLSITSGGANVFIGAQAGQNTATGSNNTVIGYQAGFNTASSNNTDIGFYAGHDLTTTSQNTNIGGYAGSSNNSGYNNTAIGYKALNNATASDNSVGIGVLAGSTLADGSTPVTTVANSFFLGYNTHPLNANSNSEIVIGTGATGNGNNTTTLTNTGNTGIYGYGTLNLKSYGTGANTGTAAYNLSTTSAGKIIEVPAGSKLILTTGANQSVNSATLVGGTVTVLNTSVTASSQIFLTVKTAGGTQGFLSTPTITAGTSFVIQSSSATETSTVNYWIIN